MRKKFWNAYFGNFFEHYDAALYSLLAPFLALQIFPSHEPITALILTYAMIPISMVARPLGSILFGFVGDIYGRGFALFLTLGGMGLVSLAMAFSPTYVQAGIIAPLIFCLGRFLQNFFAAGETMGGAIFLLDRNGEKQQDLISGAYGTSSIGGILLASAGVSLIARFDAGFSGWRMLYLVGVVTALFGCLLRKSGVESRKSERASDGQGVLRKMANQAKSLVLYRKELFAMACLSGFGYANYSIALVLTNGLIPLISESSKQEMANLNMWLLVLDFCTLPLFGYVALKISREKLMLSASFAIFFMAPFAFLLLQNGKISTIIGVRVFFVLAGVAFYAPLHAWAQRLVPYEHRYAVISFGYALGSQLLGAPTAVLSLWCFKMTGSPLGAAAYWMFLSLLSSFAILAVLKKETGGIRAHER